MLVTAAAATRIKQLFLHMNLGSVGFPCTWSAACFWWEPMRIGVELWIENSECPITLLSVSKHWREHSVLSLSSRMASSFLHLSLGWWPRALLPSDQLADASSRMSVGACEWGMCDVALSAFKRLEITCIPKIWRHLKYVYFWLRKMYCLCKSCEKL